MTAGLQNRHAGKWRGARTREPRKSYRPSGGQLQFGIVDFSGVSGVTAVATV